MSGPCTIGELGERLRPGFRGKWATAPNPGPDGIGSAVPGGSSLVVFADHRANDPAWDCLAQLLPPAAPTEFHALTGDLPARRSAWTQAGLARGPRAAPFAHQCESARASPTVHVWARIGRTRGG